MTGSWLRPVLSGYWRNCRSSQPHSKKHCWYRKKRLRQWGRIGMRWSMMLLRRLVWQTWPHLSMKYQCRTLSMKRWLRCKPRYRCCSWFEYWPGLPEKCRPGCWEWMRLNWLRKLEPCTFSNWHRLYYGLWLPIVYRFRKSSFGEGLHCYISQKLRQSWDRLRIQLVLQESRRSILK